MSRTDRSQFLRSRRAAVLAALVLSQHSAHSEPVTLAPVPSAHNSATLSRHERRTLAADLLAYRIAQDSQKRREAIARGYALAVIA